MKIIPAIIAGVAGITLLAGCSSGGVRTAATKAPAPVMPTSAAAPAPSAAPSDTRPSVVSVAPVPTDTPAPAASIGESVTVFDSGGSFDLVIDRAIAVVKPAGNPNYWLGVPVTVTGVSGAPGFDPTHLTLAR